MAESKNPQQEEKRESEIIDKRTMKRIFYGSNILLIGVAFFILLIMFFVSWDFIDRTERLAKAVVENTCRTLSSAEETLVDVEEEISLLGETIEGVDKSISYLSDGVEEAANALKSLGNSLAVLQTFGIYVGDDIDNSADSLESASVSLANTSAGLSSHKEKISEIQTDLAEIKESVSSQKQLVCDQTNIIESFDSIRLTVIILFLLAAALIFIPFVNSAAGMI